MVAPHGRRALGLTVALALATVALLASVRHAEPLAPSSAVAAHEARDATLLPPVIRDLTPRASLPEAAVVSSAAVVSALAALVGLVALFSPRALRPARAAGLARRRAPPRA